MAFQYNVPEFAARQQGLERQTEAEQAAIERRRRIAEAMMSQAQAPIDIPMAGQGRPAPIHPLQGIAKLVEAYIAKQKMGEAEKQGADFSKKKSEDEAAILSDYDKARMSEIDKIRQGFMPTPASPMPAAELGGGPYRPEVPKTLDEQRAAFQQSQLSEFPEARRFGEVQQKFIESDEAAKLAREEKAQAAKMAAEERDRQARIAAQERLERDRMIAGLKNSQEKPLTAQQKAKLDSQIASDFSSATTSVQAMKDIADSIADVRESKELGARTGYTGYVPAFAQGGEAMAAENRIQSLKGKVTQLGKQISSLGGALGNMAVQEWKIVSDAVNAIDPTAANFDEQLSNIEAHAVGATNRIKDIYDRQYGDKFDAYPQFSTENIKTYSIREGRKNDKGQGADSGKKFSDPAKQKRYEELKAMQQQGRL